MKLSLLTLMLCGIAAAQNTVYTMAPVQNYGTPQFYCDMASRYPVDYFYQFSCRGIKLVDTSGTPAGTFYLLSNGVVELSVAGIPAPVNTQSSYVTAAPSGALPATFTFSFQVEGADNIVHSGTATVTWKDFVVCGGRGCQWHSPELLSLVLSVDPIATSGVIGGGGDGH